MLIISFVQKEGCKCGIFHSFLVVLFKVCSEDLHVFLTKRLSVEPTRCAVVFVELKTKQARCGALHI